MTDGFAENAINTNLDEKKLAELQEALPNLKELDMLEWVWNNDIKGDIFSDLCDKYLIVDEDTDYADDSEEVNDIKSHIIEWFGEDHAFAIKDGEYILLTYVMMEDGMKYWSIPKINVNNQEMARKVAYMIDFVSKL